MGRERTSQYRTTEYTHEPEPANGKNYRFPETIKEIKNVEEVATGNASNTYEQHNVDSAVVREPMATTTDSNDAEVEIAKMANQVSMNPGLLLSATTGFKQDIVNFLEKPYPLQVGTFQSSDGPGTFPPVQLFKTITAIDIYGSKLKGALGLRATIVLKIQMNGDRFMQGRYIMGLLPMVTATQGTSAGDYLNSINRMRQMLSTKTSVTQLPRVEFDLNCDTEAILEIPYVSPYSHYAFNSKHGDVGSMFLYPYVPLTTGTTGSSTCQYTIWCSMKDVEIVGPTLPQMAGSNRRNPRPAGRVLKRGSVTEAEQEAASIGPITSVLRSVAKTADIVAQIPMITAVAKPVSWATNILSQAANVFGWSKPLNIAPPMRMQHIWAPFWNNPDAADYSQPLSMMLNNSLETLPGMAGTDVDETSIDYLKTIPAFATSVQWTTTASNGANLYTTRLAPANFVATYNDTGTDFAAMTPVGFLSKMFNNYRGSLRFTIKIVKTEFHSGRLVFSYAPRQVDGPDFNLGDSAYLHREIIDVRYGNEFSFVVPYCSVQQYRKVTDPYGSIQLNVLNQLTAPASVNNSVTILIEVSGAPDLEFSFPAAPNLCPHVPLIIQGAGFDFQMAMDDDSSCMIQNGVVNNASIFHDGLAAARFCVGEKISSLMSFLKQAKKLRFRTDPGPSDSYLLLPFLQSHSITNGDKSIDKGDVVPDFYSIICSCYALSRGGVRLKLYTPTGLQANTIMTIMKDTLAPTGPIMYGPLSSVTDGSQIEPLMLTTSHNTSSSAVEIQVPQYGRFPVRVNSECWRGLSTRLVSIVRPGVPDQIVFAGLSASSSVTLYRAVADDFQLGYFVCVPPMLTQ